MICVVIKLNRANALLCLTRNFVNRHILRTIYFAIFDTHINYANLIWGQNLKVLEYLQKPKTLKMTFFLVRVLLLD